MAIWTLTSEKAARLRKEVEDKREEIDVLIKKSPKDLWSADLDQFLEQWYYQLEEDKRIEQTIVRKKNGKVVKTIKGKGRAKAKKGSDDSEDDYDATPAAKRKGTKQTTLPFKAVEDKKPKLVRKAAVKKPVLVDNDDSALDDDDYDMIQEKAAPAKAKAPPKAKAPVPKIKELDDDDLEAIGGLKPPSDGLEDNFLTADEDPENAGSEIEFSLPKKDVDSKPEYSDDDSDLQIVAPKKATESKPAAKPKAPPKPKAAPKPKAVAKPKIVAAKPAAKAKPAIDDDSIFDMDDSEEDVAPKPRAKRPAAKKNTILDDLDSEDNLGDVSGMVKGLGGTSPVSSRPLFSASSKSSGATSKAVAAIVSKKAAASKKMIDLDDDEDEDEFGFNEPKKATPVKKAPTKKAALIKKAPAKAAAKPRGKKIVDSEDEMDIDDEVNDLLSDSDMEDAPPAKASSPRARPGRGRAAAAKPVVYKLDSDDDEEESEEGDYGDDDEEDYE